VSTLVCREVWSAIHSSDQGAVVNNPAEQTAIGPMVIVAADQFEKVPLVHDPWAGRMLPPSGRLAASLARFASARRAFFAVTERRIRGGWANFLCRKRYVDDQVVEAVAEGVDAVVILGAGYDTRAYRMPQLAAVPVCEVDLPGNIARKAAAVRRCFGRVPSNVSLLAVDFESDNLSDCLTRKGFGTGKRIFYVWEGVTPYLTESATRATMEHLADAAPGSGLVFTYIRKDFLNGQNMFGAHGIYQEAVIRRRLWHFGLAPEAVAGFLSEYGWSEADQVGPEEYAARYLEPAGRDGLVSEIERAVYAQR
jgi:methyltransferase (TIGR00027 family)